MKAGVFTGTGQIEPQQLETPSPGPGEVLVKVAACGVCGTDYHIHAGELTAGVVPPVVLGHEIAGTVAACGKGVEAFEEGQFCAVDPVIGCGVCPACRSHRPNLCMSPNIIGYKLNGGFAQYLCCPAGQVVPLNDHAGPAGGVLCETLACVVNGYDKLAPRPGASAMVLGAGTVGLLWGLLLRCSPLSLRLQSEPEPYRRGLAEEICMVHHALDSADPDLPAKVRDLTGGGVDYVIDATGNPQAVQQGIELLADGGTFMIFGVCPSDAEIRLNPFELYNKQARILSSKMPPGTLDRAVHLIEAGLIPSEQLVTETRPLSDLGRSVAAFNEHRNTQVKVAIDPWA